MLLRIFFLLIICLQVQASEWSGHIDSEIRYFTQKPLATEQYDGFNLSLAGQLEYHHEWDNGYQSFTFVPFVRVDQHDSERTHMDIRELTWLKAARDWELRVGIRKLFWGVTESQHLVDIINQSDSVEHPDGEDKLGQPMVNLALIRDWGTVDLFILPGFRERTFPARDGRLLGGGIPINVEQVSYESGAEEKHVDLAVRWSHTIGDWDIGLSHFSGTNRDPLLLPSFDVNNDLTLTPYYEQIQQTGLDIQITQEDMIWKFEAISRKGQEERFTAMTGGLEYTFVGILDSDADLGVLVEYLFDDRNENASTPFENDIMLGMRMTLNDTQSTELLAGTIISMENESRSYLLEASRRFGDSWKVSLEAYLYSNISPTDLMYGMRNEDLMQLTLAWYF
ncbi:hypothetical protein QUF74_03565 [Candidatus Halobeggiatoa sp. HSG11]|nr:hypothetical protein [Candidatus Halobeggiatoa sp. HSG11]